MSKPIDPWELLREARETLHDFAENFDCDGDSHKYNTTCRACDAAKQRDRIDAALATREAENQIDWKARSVTLEKALRASCVPGCSHEGESWDEEHGKQRDEEYHAGWIALGESRCGYCGRDHRNTK